MPGMLGGNAHRSGLWWLWLRVCLSVVVSLQQSGLPALAYMIISLGQLLLHVQHFPDMILNTFAYANPFTLH